MVLRDYAVITACVCVVVFFVALVVQLVREQREIWRMDRKLKQDLAEHQRRIEDAQLEAVKQEVYDRWCAVQEAHGQDVERLEDIKRDIERIRNIERDIQEESA